MIWRSWCWCPIRRNTRAGISGLTQGGRIVAEGGERLTYSGVALMRPEFFAGAAPGRFPCCPWLMRALEAGRLGGQRHDGLWLDVGTPERLAQLDATLARVRG